MTVGVGGVFARAQGVMRRVQVLSNRMPSGFRLEISV